MDKNGTREANTGLPLHCSVLLKSLLCHCLLDSAQLCCSLVLNSCLVDASAAMQVRALKDTATTMTWQASTSKLETLSRCVGLIIVRTFLCLFSTCCKPSSANEEIMQWINIIFIDVCQHLDAILNTSKSFCITVTYTKCTSVSSLSLVAQYVPCV